MFLHKDTPDWYNNAARLLRNEFSDEVVDTLRRMIAKNPNDWYVGIHHGFGRGVRNSLRALGFGDQEYGNMDDHYVPIVEMAVRISA